MQDRGLQHVALEETHAVSSRPHVRSIHEYWSPDEGLNQIRCRLHRFAEAFPGVGILQNVDRRGGLLLLEEVQDAHKIIKVAEARVLRSSLASCAADALALPAATYQVHKPVAGD